MHVACIASLIALLAINVLETKELVCTKSGKAKSSVISYQTVPGKKGASGLKGFKGETGGITEQDLEKLEKEAMFLEQYKARLANWTKRLKDLLTTILTKNSKRMEEYYYECCGVGITDRRIPDSAMTASSFWDVNRTASKARFGTNTYWHPRYRDNCTARQCWLQVDMGKPTTIVGIVTQGRPPAPNSQSQFLKSYKILYGNSTTALSAIKDPNTKNDLVFSGNVDRTSYKMNKFPQPISAKYFRLNVVSYNFIPSLRLEYLIC